MSLKKVSLKIKKLFFNIVLNNKTSLKNSINIKRVKFLNEKKNLIEFFKIELKLKKKFLFFTYNKFLAYSRISLKKKIKSKKPKLLKKRFNLKKKLKNLKYKPLLKKIEIK